MKLALGTVQFGMTYGIANHGGQVSQAAAGRILALAASHGIDMLDTAIAYGDSEQALGQLGVADWQIVTKLPSVPDDCKDVAGWVETQISGSLARLGVARLHGVLLHRPEQFFDLQGAQLLAALKRLKEQGMTRKIGVSVYAPDELERLFNAIDFDLVQVPLNIFDRRLMDSGWAQRLKGLGVELHARSVFLQGLLLMPASRRPAKFTRWAALWSQWERWLTETGLTPLQACLNYALAIPEVDKLVIGVDGVDHLHEILAAINRPSPGLPDWPGAIDPDLLNPARWSLL
jgi:aryl-alcohol dehydrogenase-like predicted oxidoreductase